MSSIKQAFILSSLQALALAAPAGNQARQAAPPAVFEANNNIGPGGTTFKDSDHFRVYGAPDADAEKALNMLEAAYSCFVGTLGWRNSGLSINDASGSGSYTKVNTYSVASLSGGAAGVMSGDAQAGVSWLQVVDRYLTDPGVTVHEYGHGLTYSQINWVDQGLTGAWWEPLAEWVADMYMTSPVCEEARTQHGESASPTRIRLAKIISDSHQVLVDGSVDSGNYYESWPFMSYLTYNPDNYTGLGQDVVREAMAQYPVDSNETPLHTFARLADGTAIQKIVGRYWARMAFVDIGHPSAQSVFLEQRATLNYDNLDASGKVKSDRAPRYMGANIIPLTISAAGKVSAKVTSTGSYTATLSIRDTESGATRYVEFLDGAAEADVTASEEAAVVVANTPELVQYDPFNLTAEVNTGMDYSLEVTGATVASSSRRARSRSAAKTLKNELMRRQRVCFA
ncbi:hypothetical protein BS50DRAFT_312764 [Corynespora cassiicola Philippines]|uniref:Dockerin type 1 n=1 Tax=Corynespora cassiicola Philippines TaxID=1448308 RepID=A0A2T2NYE3_CORCC|nr:hypothetical protein BS50DRAFT_312764 [Corynespora cassiicola Philippines]